MPQHDQHFKNLILDYPREALAFFAAAEASVIDEGARITPIRQEQLQERLGERFRELDVPLLVEWPDGQRAAVLFLVEQETEPRRFSIHRLGHYCLDLAELFETDRVVPVVVFLRRGEAPRSLRLGGVRREYLTLRYLSCELGSLSNRAYRDSTNLVARLNLPNMAHERSERVEVYGQAVRGLRLLEPDPERQLKYLDFIDIYTALDDNERDEYQRRYPEEAEMVSTFAERFKEEGLEQGKQQGLQEGLQEGLEQGKQLGLRQGEAAVLLRQLERKFGADALAPYRPRVEAADPDTLLAWSERILTASSIDEVFGGA